ncbi:MAG: YqaA family protein [Pseudomonadota bacterium]
MIRRLYDWTLEMATRPWALWAMAAVSFMESSIFPITPLVMVIPMVLARPDRAWLIAGVCTLASTAGGVFGWVIGATLYQEVGLPVLEFYGKADRFDEAAAMFRDNGFIAVFLAAFTPFPYKVITIASGVAGLSIWTLIAASLVGRGLQFFLVAGVLRVMGEPAKALIDRYFGIIATVGAILLIGGFLLVKVVA